MRPPSHVTVETASVIWLPSSSVIGSGSGAVVVVAFQVPVGRTDTEDIG